MTNATRWCLLCGAEYVAGVLECADCLVPLSDRQPLRIDELGGDEDEQVAYDFDELEPHARLVIDELFWTNGIAHAWDETSLIVRPEDETEADRLMHDPLDHEGVLSLVDGARLAETLPLPYGFAPAVWNDLVTQAQQLRAALEKDDVDDDQIIEQATRLRTTLRNFV